MKLSEFNELQTSEVNNLEFEVDHNRSFSNTSFNNCTFKFTNNGNLRFSGAAIKNCRFIGLDGNTFEEFANGCGDLDLQNVELLSDSSISGSFRKIGLSVRLIQRLDDTSFCNNYSTISSTIWESKINGFCYHLSYASVTFIHSEAESVCNKLREIDIKKSLSNVRFERNIPKWEKEILHTASCTQVVFNNYQVHPYFFATKCKKDSNGVDFSNAILIDNWSRLRKQYTGLSLLVIIILTLAFFLPLILKYVMLVSTSAQIGSSILGQSNKVINIIYDKIPFYEVLFFNGKSGLVGWLHFFLTSLLIAYNFTRLYITFAVSKLREEERFVSDSKFPISSLHPKKYGHLVIISAWLRGFFILVFLYSLFKFGSVFFMDIIDFESIDFEVLKR